ncbi:MAG: hypothetical protein GX346_05205, partial [Clostridiales bacterium]|nr:hypothetical protein [Clostridiales bacterium]
PEETTAPEDTKSPDDTQKSDETEDTGKNGGNDKTDTPNSPTGIKEIGVSAAMALISIGGFIASRRKKR